MKPQTIIPHLLFFIFLTIVARAQCPTGDVTLLSQAEVNAFATNYPSCTTLPGHLGISGNNIMDLSPLENLETIGGYLLIYNNSSLKNVDGLSSLSSIGGDLNIYNNGSLANVDGLSSLTSIDGGLNIYNNGSLANVDGLSSLTSIGVVLEIRDNSSLMNVDGLSALNSIGASLYIFYNSSLTNVDGLSSLLSIGRKLYIVSNVSLTNVGGLSSLSSIGGDLALYNNGALANLDGLSSLSSVGGNLDIRDNSSLTNVDGLSSLSSVGGWLWIQNNAILPSLEGLENIDPGSITDLRIQDNPILSYCDLSNICTYLEGTGPRTISNNTGECATEADVAYACLPEVVSVSDPEAIVELCYGTAWEDVRNLPDIVLVTLEDDSVVEVSVEWKKGGYNGVNPGKYELKGELRIAPGADYNNLGKLEATQTLRILPSLEIQLVSGVARGDTIHLTDCLPPDISRDDLDISPHRGRISFRSNIYPADLPEPRPHGMWKLLEYTYEVTDRCGVTKSFENFVALYDLDPPVFRNFPPDISIDSPDRLPPAPSDVRILDICRYVVWDTVTTTPIVDPETSDTLAFVRRWTAEDGVGNKSFRDQMIYIHSVPRPDLNRIKAHIVKESDLPAARFPGGVGTDSIPVTLYRIDSVTGSNPVDTRLSGNWQGSKGTVVFSPLLPGSYRINIDVPPGYEAFHPDSLIMADGWSDTLVLSGDSTLDLETILLVPVRDTTAMAGSLVEPGIPDYSEISAAEIKPVSIYPNPTSGRIKIEVQKGISLNYTIFNHLGRVMENGRVENGSVLDLSKQAHGMYFIRLENQGFVATKKILLFNQ
ncbi:T9SS type A sorting domain-containing protein [Membranicola marinus]|uniref:T9SS type A sorting domain-containing protein n=1 Tax=Membranihabitans marinus TaxID=1227546 RepID=A0A953L7R3_9BACT|nr:T9SS type A sorting domain-containing protein [Membranihabitans marinus]MBY5958992.1 T9SS type A sorting domain-containing protein [Membranihabitans marinus]